MVQVLPLPRNRAAAPPCRLPPAASAIDSLSAAAPLDVPAGQCQISWPEHVAAQRAYEHARGAAYPLSRLWIRPAAFEVARRLAATRVQPVQVTFVGLLAAAVSILLLVDARWASAWGALGVLGWWFCDRIDGQLARLQGRATAAGAWLDANVDELVDLTIHGALAMRWFEQSGGPWPGIVYAAFLSGKYLTMYGLHTEEHAANGAAATRRTHSPDGYRISRLRACYHLLGNADFRVHALALALLCDAGAVELVLFAGYYQLRWSLRYGLVWSRLRGLDR